MHDDRCDVCGQPAVVSDTAVASNGTVTSRRLCAEHGAIDRDAILGGSRADAEKKLADLTAYFRGLTAAERARIEQEFRTTHRRA